MKKETELKGVYNYDFVLFFSSIQHFKAIEKKCTTFQVKISILYFKVNNIFLPKFCHTFVSSERKPLVPHALLVTLHPFRNPTILYLNSFWDKASSEKMGQEESVPAEEINAATCNSKLQSGKLYRVNLQFEGSTRSSLIFIPSTLSPSHLYPLVINFHGGGGCASQHMNSCLMNSCAERNKFIVVYPNGYGK